MLIFSFIILIWVTTRRVLHALVVKTHQFSHPVQSCSSVFTLCLFSYCLFKLEVCSDWPAQTRPTQQQSSCAKSIQGHKLYKCTTWRRSVMSQSHRNKGEATGEAFEEQRFVWERGASV